MLLGPIDYIDIYRSDQASTIESDLDILQPPSNISESNGLYQSKRSPLQIAK